MLDIPHEIIKHRDNLHHTITEAQMHTSNVKNLKKRKNKTISPISLKRLSILFKRLT